MQIDVDNLPPRGIKVTATGADAWAATAAESALGEVPSDLQVDVQVYRNDRGARVRGTLQIEVPHDCDRCAVALVLRLGGDIDLTYVKGAPSLPDGVELQEDELDVGWYDGPRFDLAAVLSEQLALWLPDVVRCATPGAERTVPGECVLPVQDPGPELKRRNPFAGIVLPE